MLKRTVKETRVLTWRGVLNGGSHEVYAAVEVGRDPKPNLDSKFKHDFQSHYKNEEVRAGHLAGGSGRQFARDGCSGRAGPETRFGSRR